MEKNKDGDGAKLQNRGLEGMQKQCMHQQLLLTSRGGW